MEKCIEEQNKCNSILELLPTLRSELLQLECSRKIYDREVSKLIKYLHDIIFDVK